MIPASWTINCRANRDVSSTSTIRTPLCFDAIQQRSEPGPALDRIGPAHISIVELLDNLQLLSLGGSVNGNRCRVSLSLSAPTFAALDVRRYDTRLLHYSFSINWLLGTAVSNPQKLKQHLHSPAMKISKTAAPGGEAASNFELAKGHYAIPRGPQQGALRFRCAVLCPCAHRGWRLRRGLRE